MHGGNLLEARERYGKASFIDLSANINPFGPPKGVWEAVSQGLPQIIHYPDPEYRRLRRKLALKFTLPEECILLGNGAGELLFALAQALRPTQVLIPVPGFSEYERAARACGAAVRRVALGAEGWTDQNLALCQAELKKLSRGDLFFLNTPHNPTGSVLEQSKFAGLLAQACEQGIWVVLDESFVDFLNEDQRWSGRDYLHNHANLLVVYSLTKFYAIPGLRLGAVFAWRSLLERIQEQRDPWGVNILAEEAGLAAIDDQDYPERVRKLLQECRDYFYEGFANAGFADYKLFPSSANFALIQVLRGNAADVTENLGKQGILVRDCSNFQGLEGEFIRSAIKEISSMQALLEGLQALDRG